MTESRRSSFGIDKYVVVNTLDLMQVVFDQAKRDVTLAERGLDFADAISVFNGRSITFEDARRDYGESRFITIGESWGSGWSSSPGLPAVTLGESSARGEQMSESNPSTPWVDPDDAPPITAADLERATFQIRGRQVSRAEFQQDLVKRPPGRPPVPVKRPMLSMRVDVEVLTRLRASGKGWQTRVNALLKEAVEQGRL